MIFLSRSVSLFARGAVVTGRKFDSWSVVGFERVCEKCGVAMSEDAMCMFASR